MIDVKIIAKAKSGDAVGSSSTVVVQKSAVADEATRAARADFADAANKAGYADLSGYADRAGTAEVAYGLTDDNIIKDQFLSKVIDDTAAGNITFAQDIAVTGDATIGGDVTVTGDVTADEVNANSADIDEIITESVKTATFDPDPLTGVGFGIYKDALLNNSSKAVVDYLTVRKGMKVAVLEIAEYRSVNGGFILSPANGTIKTVTTALATDGTNYICDLKDDSNTFVVGDLVRCQRWDMSINPSDPLKYYWLEVTAVNQSVTSRNSITIFVPTGYSGMLPAADDVIVQMGNTDSVNHADRQGFVIIVDDGMSVYSGVNSTSLTGKLKSKFGNLNNMTWHGRSLSGYGLLGDSVYLSGKFLLENTTGGTTTYVDIDSELGTITSSVSRVNDTLANGCVNLARLTNQGKDGWSYWDSESGTATISDYQTDYVEFYVSGAPYECFQQLFNFTAPMGKAIESGKKYTVSFEIIVDRQDTELQEGDVPRDLSVKLQTGSTSSQTVRWSSETTSVEGTDDWQKITLTATASASSAAADTTAKFVIRINDLTLHHLCVRNLQFEEGEIATPYMAAPEDVHSEIQQSADAVTLSVTNSLATTGININTGVITLQAGTVQVQPTTAGSQPSILFNPADGTINSNRIRANELDTNHLIARDSNNYVKATVNADFVNGTLTQTNDGAYRIYYPSNGSQNTAKKLELLDVNRGTSQDPYWTTMRMFESDGQTIAWELGTDAMTAGFTNPYVTALNLSTLPTSDSEAQVVGILPSEKYSWNTNTGEIYEGTTGTTYYEADYSAERNPAGTIVGTIRYTRRKWTDANDNREWVEGSVVWDVSPTPQ